jgi:hypothetical protein
MPWPKINRKKFALIIGFIAIVLIFAFLLYYIFLRPFVAPPTPPPEVVPPAQLPPTFGVTPTPSVVVTPPPTPPAPPVAPPLLISPRATSTGFTASTSLVPKETKGTILAANGQDLLYYEKESGKFFRLDRDGKLSLLTDKLFYNVSEITWAPNTSRTILEYPDGSKIFYDFDTKEQATIPKQWKDFSFSPASDKIVFKEMNYDPDNRWISIASPGGSGLQPIEHLGTKDSDVLVTWSPNNQVVALYRESINANQAEVYFIGLHGENFKSLKVEGQDLRAIWSPEGDRLLYSVFSFNSNYNPSLWAAKAEGEEIGSVRINFKLATWTDKCAFANNTTAYCAAPKTMESGTGYFPELADNIPDLIYKLDLETGIKVKVAEPLGGYTIGKLVVSSDEKYLYFTDKKTNQIYKIDL